MRLKTLILIPYAYALYMRQTAPDLHFLKQEYEKLDHEIDLEAAPFTGLADGTGLSWKQPGESGKTVRAFLGRMRKNWRDWLVSRFSNPRLRSGKETEGML